MPSRDRKALIAAWALGLVSLLWGTSFAIIKDLTGQMPPFTLMLLRFGGSTLLLALCFGHRLKGLTGSQLRRSGIIGLVLTAAFVALILGIQHTTASNQSFLVGAGVVFVPFLSWAVTRRRPGPYAVAGVALATLGIGLLTLDDSLSMNKGDLLSLLCSFGVAGHLVAIERLGRDIDPIASTLVQFAVVTAGFAVLTGLYESFRPEIPPRLWPVLAYLVVVITVIAFVAQNMAQRHLSATSAALILTLETAFGGLFAVLYLHERLTLRMFLGCLTVLAGILTEETRWRFLRRGGNASP